MQIKEQPALKGLDGTVLRIYSLHLYFSYNPKGNTILW